MTLSELGQLLMVYLPSLVFIITLAWREFKRVRFNFHVFFTILYLLTFYFGFPLTCALSMIFDVQAVPTDSLLYALLCSTSFYALYYITYKVRLTKRLIEPEQAIPFTMNRVETLTTCTILVLVASVTLGIFFLQNGLLLFKLSSYSQIFGKTVTDVALKRFFYFFIPAMLIVYFLRPTWRNWILFLVSTVIFGALTYIIVGGTRANMFIAFALFLFIGISRRWITLWMLVAAGLLGVVAMFWLALKRYDLQVNGMEAFYTFLYLTRDTFSPWENLALLINHYDKIDFQGLAPIVRDFYVFIPQSIWPQRPDLILNTANYFTWDVLNYYAGLAISPTLIGSLLVMGGVYFVPLGAIVVGLLIKWFDWIYVQSALHPNRYVSAIVQAFCFGAVFNLIVLVREGLDSFFSRVVFFILVFGLAIILSKLLYWLLHAGGLIKTRVVNK